MGQDPNQQENAIKRRPAGIDTKLVLIVITLVLFIIALYFEYKGAGQFRDPPIFASGAC